MDANLKKYEALTSAFKLNAFMKQRDLTQFPKRGILALLNTIQTSTWTLNLSLKTVPTIPAYSVEIDQNQVSHFLWH